jgi:glycosyltransferase involved in cell wall biosynthesis
MAVPSDRVILIPNGISKEQFYKLEFADKDCNLSHSLEISYVGNVGLAQNLSVLLEVAQRMPELQINIVGGGTDFDRIRDITERKGLSNVRLFGRVSWDRVREIYERTDVLYAQLTYGFEGAVPSKLYEYLATGKPVIYGGMGEAATILADFENVKCVPPDDVDCLVREFSGLLERKGSLGFSQANRQRVEKYFIRENHVSEWFSKVGFVHCPAVIHHQR